MGASGRLYPVMSEHEEQMVLFTTQDKAMVRMIPLLAQGDALSREGTDRGLRISLADD